jgi:hypothetical protein
MFRGWRFDKRRWKIAPLVLNIDGQRMLIRKDAVSAKKTYNVESFNPKKFSDKNYLVPIPLSEIEKSPALIQNPGY